MSAIRKTRRRRSLVGSAIRKTRRRSLLKPETPHAREGPRRGVRQLWTALAGLTALGRCCRRSSVHGIGGEEEGEEVNLQARR